MQRGFGYSLFSGLWEEREGRGRKRETEINRKTERQRKTGKRRGVTSSKERQRDKAVRGQEEDLLALAKGLVRWTGLVS